MTGNAVRVREGANTATSGRRRCAPEEGKEVLKQAQKKMRKEMLDSTRKKVAQLEEDGTSEDGKSKQAKSMVEAGERGA